MIEGVPLTMVPVGHMFLLFDPADPGNHLAIWCKSAVSACLPATSWCGKPYNSNNFAAVPLDEEHRFTAILLDQTHADALIMASMHGVVGERWFMLVERLTGIAFSENFGPRMQAT